MLHRKVNYSSCTKEMNKNDRLAFTDLFRSNKQQKSQRYNATMLYGDMTFGITSKVVVVLYQRHAQ
jgi:hypothetical protein